MGLCKRLKLGPIVQQVRRLDVDSTPGCYWTHAIPTGVFRGAALLRVRTEGYSRVKDLLLLISLLKYMCVCLRC